jgi:hypothetical protein
MMIVSQSEHLSGLSTFLKGQIHDQCVAGSFSTPFVGGAHSWNVVQSSFACKKAHRTEKWASKLLATPALCAVRRAGGSMGLGKQNRLRLSREVSLEDMPASANRNVDAQTAEVVRVPQKALPASDRGPGERNTGQPGLAVEETEDKPLLASENASQAQERSGSWGLPKGRSELLLFLVPLLWGKKVEKSALDDPPACRLHAFKQENHTSDLSRIAQNEQLHLRGRLSLLDRIMISNEKEYKMGSTLGEPL